MKFLEPKQESAGKIGVVGIKFYGFLRKPVLVEDQVVVCTAIDIVKTHSYKVKHSYQLKHIVKS